MGGTLTFSSTGAYGENYWIAYNLLQKYGSLNHSIVK